jgi:serine/threonine-protein kinase
VTLAVSKGPANITVPVNIGNMTESSARDALRAVGLKGGEVTESTSADVAQGRVLTSDPQPGQSVPAGSAVNLVLSNGRVVVPQVTGLSEAAAAAALKDGAVKLPFRVEYAAIDGQEPGLVLEQSEPATSEVDQGTEIVLTVSQQPEPSPEPVPEQTPTPAPAPTSPAPADTKPAPGGKPTEKPSQEPSAEPGAP